MHWFDKYANEIAIDATIKTCIRLNVSREKPLQTVLEDFPQMSEEQISKRVSELWENTIREKRK